MQNSEKSYALDFPSERWSKRDRFFLEPFATNIGGFVTVLRNLPPEIAGALCSRASRANGSLLRILLDEYIYPIIDGEDKELAEELNSLVRYLRSHGFKKILNNQRAQKFYAKWLSQYGDDSIAQLTGVHLVFWGISQVAMKYFEDQRIGLEPIEKSTRYVNFANKINDRYLYYRPYPNLQRLKVLSEYQNVMDNLFDVYAELVPILTNWLKENFDEKESVLEKKAFDTLRGLLPMSTLGQVAFRGNAQAFEYLINRSAQHELGELRLWAESMRMELDQEIPSLLSRLDDQKSQDYQHELRGRRQRIRESGWFSGYQPSFSPSVTLLEYDPEAEVKIITALLFPETHYRWEKIIQVVKQMTVEERENIFSRHFEGRTARWQKVGRAFENSYLRFEVVMNIGAYRDLHRHRMLTQERQRFSTHHGYDVPKELVEAGLNERFSEALEAVQPLFRKIEESDPDLAQYVVPLAYRVRFYQWENFRELFWETELRTIPQGHPDYRVIEQEKYRQIQGVFPLLGKHMLVDMNEYRFARRGTEEEIARKEEGILRKLSEK